MLRLLPPPNTRPFRSLELPLSIHLDIEQEALRLSVAVNTSISKGAVVLAAATYYQSIPEDQRPLTEHCGPRTSPEIPNAADPAGVYSVED